jgi:hypothetical protein
MVTHQRWEGCCVLSNLLLLHLLFYWIFPSETMLESSFNACA